MSTDATLREARLLVVYRAHGKCECCGVRGTEFSHRQARGMGGTHGRAAAAAHSASNGVFTCRFCHLRIEANPVWAYAAGLKVRRGFVLPAFVPVELRDGWWFLADDGTRSRYSGDMPVVIREG